MASARPIPIGGVLIAPGACSRGDDDERTSTETIERPAASGPDGVRVVASLSVEAIAPALAGLAVEVAGETGDD